MVNFHNISFFLIWIFANFRRPLYRECGGGVFLPAERAGGGAAVRALQGGLQHVRLLANGVLAVLYTLT